jgi:hypothetical protein
LLSRYTVLPWESADEYRAVVEALVAEHGPQGPTSPCFVGSTLSLTRGIPCTEQ